MYYNPKGLDKVDYHKALGQSDKLKDITMFYVVTRVVEWMPGYKKVVYRTYRTPSVLMTEGDIVYSFLTEDDLIKWEQDNGLSNS